jgi:hypothetical protein
MNGQGTASDASRSSIDVHDRGCPHVMHAAIAKLQILAKVILGAEVGLMSPFGGARRRTASDGECLMRLLGSYPRMRSREQGTPVTCTWPEHWVSR